MAKQIHNLFYKKIVALQIQADTCSALRFPCALSHSAAARNSSGADLLAVACSALTGDEWRGRIALLDARTLCERASLPAASGVSDVHWLDGCGAAGVAAVPAPLC